MSHRNLVVLRLCVLIAHTYTVSHVTYDSVMSHINKSCHIWMSHGTHEWVMAHMNDSWHTWMSHGTLEWVITHIMHCCSTLLGYRPSSLLQHTTATHYCNILLWYSCGVPHGDPPVTAHCCNTLLQHTTATHDCNTLPQHATATHYCSTHCNATATHL